MIPYYQIVDSGYMHPRLHERYLDAYRHSQNAHLSTDPLEAITTSLKTIEKLNKIQDRYANKTERW